LDSLYNHANIHINLLNLLSPDVFSGVNNVQKMRWRPGWTKAEGSGGEKGKELESRREGYSRISEEKGKGRRKE